MIRPRVAHASFDCSGCGSRVRPGDLIVPADDELLSDGEWQHLSCTTSFDEIAEMPVCNRCFLTLCECW